MSTVSSGVGPDFRKTFVIVTVGFLPTLMAVLPWDLTQPLSTYSSAIRGYSFHVSVFHIAILSIALGLGLSIFDEWRELPKYARWAIYGLLFLSLWTSLYVAPIKYKSVIAVLQTILLLFFYLAFRFMVRKHGSNFVLQCWIALGAGVLLYLALWAVTLAIRWPPEKDWGDVAVPGMANVRSVGYFSMAAFCSGIALIIGTRNYSRLALPMVLLTAGGWGSALWTGSRGAVVAMLATALLAIALAYGDRRCLAAAIFASLLAAILFVYPLPYESPNYGLDNFLLSEQGDDIHSVSSNRTAIWAATWEMINTRPLLGLGLDQFQLHGPAISRGLKQPHNWSLQILFSVGFVGLAMMIAALVPLVSWNRKVLLARQNIASVACLGGLLVYASYDAAGYYLFPLTLAAMALASLQPPPAPDRSD